MIILKSQNNPIQAERATKAGLTLAWSSMNLLGPPMKKFGMYKAGSYANIEEKTKI